MNHAVFVSCAKGLEYLLKDELSELGLHVTQISPLGVYGEGSLTVLYQLCLWSRIANRVQLLLFSGDAHNEQTLYQLCLNFPWQTVFTPDKTFAVEFHGNSQAFRNTMFGAQVVKDAVVDHFRKITGVRPSVDKENPMIRLFAYLKDEQVQVRFDLTGYSLHQRGYRKQKGQAPLKETLAAALLMRAKWPYYAKEGYAFQDPCCGSGTLVIEAAMMAAQIAPGLIRSDQSVHHWVMHQPSLWEKTRAFALSQVKPPQVLICGTDKDPALIEMAIANAERAGVLPLISFVKTELKDVRPMAAKGLLLTNPPYGERLGDSKALVPFYQELGRIAHDYFQGWLAAFLTSDPILAKATGLRSPKQYTFYNGTLACKLYCLSLSEENRLKTTSDTPSAGVLMLINRLKKNKKNLAAWVKKNNISCYRIYDADLPEYAYAIDLYNDYAVLQEYAAPSSIPEKKAEERSLEVIQAVPAAFDLPLDHIVIKARKRQRGTSQYEKVGQKKEYLTVSEGCVKLLVNLHDYIDTGLFLDHRLLRQQLATLLPRTRFLNLFCYTGAASVHAARAGAYTTNVDLSNTYLKWAEDNFKINGLSIKDHQFIQADCFDWLKHTKLKFDVILLDPPTFSNSKRMHTSLDIQRDHQALIHAAMRLLAKGGYLYFSTNLRRFQLDLSLKDKYTIKDITAKTIDLDFKRNTRIHQCFIIEHA